MSVEEVKEVKKRLLGNDQVILDLFEEYEEQPERLVEELRDML